MLLVLAAIAACLIFAAIAATTVAIVQLAFAGLEWLAALLRRRQRARRSKPLSRRT